MRAALLHRRPSHLLAELHSALLRPLLDAAADAAGAAGGSERDAWRGCRVEEDVRLMPRSALRGGAWPEAARWLLLRWLAAGRGGAAAAAADAPLEEASEPTHTHTHTHPPTHARTHTHASLAHGPCACYAVGLLSF